MLNNTLKKRFFIFTLIIFLSLTPLLFAEHLSNSTSDVKQEEIVPEQIQQSQSNSTVVAPDVSTLTPDKDTVVKEKIIEEPVKSTEQTTQKNNSSNVSNFSNSDDTNLGRKGSSLYYPVLKDAEVSYLRMTYPESQGTYRKADLTLKWESDAPYFLLTVSNGSIRANPTIVYKIIKNSGQNQASYTIPSSLLKENTEYIIRLFATNGTDGSDPGYKSLSLWANGPSFYTFTIRTLTPPDITYPKEKQHLPKGDITVTWKGQNQSDLNYYIYLTDLTSKATILHEHGIRNELKSFVIPESSLTSGHEYQFKVEARLPGYYHDPKNKQFIGVRNFFID